jgi:outer membrane protein assembly factor BamB
MRNRALLVPLMVVVVVLASSCLWPAFRYGPERTGFNTAETTIGVANVGSLTRKWTAATGGADFTSPAVSNGFVFVSTTDGQLKSFDAAGSTGARAPEPARRCGRHPGRSLLLVAGGQRWRDLRRHEHRGLGRSLQRLDGAL